MKWRYLGVIFITFLCYRSDRQTERERDGGVEEEEKDIFLRTNKVLNPLWLFHKFDPETGEGKREVGSYPVPDMSASCRLPVLSVLDCAEQMLTFLD